MTGKPAAVAAAGVAPVLAAAGRRQPPGKLREIAMPEPTKPATRTGGSVALLTVVLITATLPAVAQDTPSMPRNSLTMQQVRSQFGEPSQERPAVGQPPIARWVYPDYTVYFEFDRVLTAVPHRLVPPAALGERPAIARR